MAIVWPRFKQNARLRSGPRLRRAALAFAVLTCSALALRAATFTAVLNPDTTTVGESVTLLLKFEGGTPRVMPSPPSIANLRFEGGGISQGFNYYNGQTSSYISQSYLVTAVQPGEYIIPSMQADVDGQLVRSAPVKLKVLKANENQQAFFKIVAPKKEIYVGEAVPVEFQVFIREDLNGEGILRQFDGYNGCPLKAEGASIPKTTHMDRRRMQANNLNYNVATLVSLVTPVKAGPLTITSMDVTLTLQNGYDPFAMIQQGKRITLIAEPQTLTVLPVPRVNVPPAFNGAVGNYTMSVTAGPTNVAVGDPVTVKVQISGRGNFDALALPEQNNWHDFKTYPSTSKFEPADALGYQGTKTFDQLVAPQNADVKEVPPFSFSFFNPDKKAYQTLTQGALPLTVRPAGSAAAPSVAVASQRSPDNPPPSQDIVHIKPRAGAIAQISLPLLTRPWFLALEGVPMLLWLAALIWRYRTDSLANNPRLRRQRQVAILVREGLDELRTLAAQNNSDGFFATLVHLLQEQLGERLDLPASAITEAVIDERLRPRQVPEATLSSLHELFQLCNLARYAPIKTSQELAAIIPKLEATLRDLQALKL